MISGSRICFRSLTCTFTFTVWPRSDGIVDRGAELGLDLARLAGLDSLERLADPGMRPSWNRSSGWSRNWISLTSLSTWPSGREDVRSAVR